jgi:hydrogenase maturation protease
MNLLQGDSHEPVAEETVMNLLPLVIGLGNSLRGDDGAGLQVVRQVREALPDAADYLLAPPDALALVNAFRGRRQVYAVDACVAPGYGPGELVLIDDLAACGSALEAGAPVRCSSHQPGLAEAMELSRVLGQAPGRVTVLGVVGQRFDRGAPRSRAVTDALPRAVSRLIELIGPS